MSNFITLTARSSRTIGLLAQETAPWSISIRGCLVYQVSETPGADGCTVFYENDEIRVIESREQVLKLCNQAHGKNNR